MNLGFKIDLDKYYTGGRRRVNGKDSILATNEWRRVIAHQREAEGLMVQYRLQRNRGKDGPLHLSMSGIYHENFV